MAFLMYAHFYETSEIVIIATDSFALVLSGYNKDRTGNCGRECKDKEERCGCILTITIFRVVTSRFRI